MSVEIRPGETLSRLAARYGTSVAELLRLNPNIRNPNRINAGQRLNVPGSSKTAARKAKGPAARSTRSSSASATAGAKYTVRPGDSLSRIGARFGVSYQAIARANGIKNANLISVGQVLTIPGQGGGAPATKSPPASKGGSAGGATYTVRSGDSLSGIGARFGVSFQAIARANGISNPNRIFPGQVLKIPGKSAGSSGSTGPVSGPGPAPGPVSGGVSVAQLRRIMPNLSAARATQMLPYLNAAMVKGGINTPLRQAAFLAQLAHESGELRYFEEIASGAAYEGRRDLGNIYPGDGVRFKGRGPIQLTGRANYRAAGAALGIDLVNNPKRAADPDVAFRVAVWFWNSRGLSAAADARNFNLITLRINGGTNGAASRNAYYARAKSVLGV